jgi:hypothetical protein
MSDAVFGEVRSYDDLHAILREVAVKRKLTRNGLDVIAGLASGHSSKLLAPVPIKRMGPSTLEPMLGALGVKLIVVSDPDALTRFAARVADNAADKPVKECEPAIPSKFVKAVLERVRAKQRKIARRGGYARAASMSPERRSQVARRAAKALWRKLTPEQRASRLAHLRACKKRKARAAAAAAE